MNSLLSLLFYQKLTKRDQKNIKNFKEKNATSIMIFKNIGMMVYVVVSFIFKSIATLISSVAVAHKKGICQETVNDEASRFDGVVDFGEKLQIKYLGETSIFEKGETYDAIKAKYKPQNANYYYAYNEKYNESFFLKDELCEKVK